MLHRFFFLAVATTLGIIHVANAGTCTLCYGGVEPTKALDVPIYTGLNVTCGDRVNELITDPNYQTYTFTSDFCLGFQERSAVECGCPRPPVNLTKCNLCVDGSLPPDLLLPVPINKMKEVIIGNCGDLLATSLGNGGAPICQGTQILGLSNCNCPIPAALASNCPLCSEGIDVPAPDTVLVPGLTCKGLARAARVQLGNACTAFQDVGGYYCGCPTVSGNDTCSICGEGVPLPEPARIITLFTGALAPCFEFELLGTVDPTTCPTYKSLAGPGCCSSDPYSANNVTDNPEPLSPATTAPVVSGAPAGTGSADTPAPVIPKANNSAPPVAPAGTPAPVVITSDSNGLKVGGGTLGLVVFMFFFQLL